jgi:putative phosphoribosyl transferase
MTTTMPFTRSPVAIRIPQGTLAGDLLVPESALGIVVFAHGSGSSAASPRNRFVAEWLAGHGLASLLFDLLTIDEWEDPARVFDIPLLSRRLVAGSDWVGTQRAIAQLPVGYFGASTGAAAALIASTTSSRPIAAVVSRGGRPDLADSVLPRVTSPTLLLVGGNDPEVLQLNRVALARMPGIKELEIVPGATHLFPEPGALASVAQHAAGWFSHYFPWALHRQ